MKNVYIKLLLFFPVLYWAQIPVVETPDNKGNFSRNGEVVLKKINIETKITGKISTNTVTMVFKNNSNRLKQGRVTFPLPEGVNVNGYALDINGKLRNAVPVEKEKAKEVYESIKKRNVDPGILEKVEGNNFRTTIYPISANGGERTIQVIYNYELNKTENNYQYFLPLNYSEEIPEFSIKTTVFQNAISPQLQEKPDGSFDFVKNGNVWVAEIHKTKYKPTNNLRINFPQNEKSQSVLMQNASNNSAYFLASLDINSAERAKKLPNKIAIVWDNSLSGQKRDHSKEFMLIEEYFKSNKDLTVKAYFINNTFEDGKSFKISDGNWNELKEYLSQITYDGGTDFEQLKTIKEDEILFFTDGLSSFGDLKLNWNQPVYTISSSNNVNFNQLKFISNKTGGEFLNLNENDPKKEVRKLLYQPLKFLGIEQNSSLSEVYPSINQTISQDFVLTGIVSGKQTTVKANFGYGNEVTQTKILVLNASEQSVKDWDISKFWAQRKLNELEIFEKQNKEEIKDLSKQFGLVSNNMSLMVLENVADYVRYELNPPSELQAEFNQIVKNKTQQKDERVKDLMANAETMTENLKKWWNKDFENNKVKKYPDPTYTRGYSRTDTARVSDIQEVVVTEALGIRREPNAIVSSNRIMEEREVRDMSIRAMSSKSEMSIASKSVVQALQGRVPGVRISEWAEDSDESINVNSGRILTIDVKSSAEYMELFSSAKTSEAIYNIYLKNRKDYQDLPQFYFDISQLLFKNNDKKAGLKVLSSIADLDLENEELYKLLAYKLKQAEIYDKELWASAKVLEWRPFDPQSYRDYALALEDNQQYQSALDNLYKVLTQSYTKELADRDSGIEETIIMEINELISKYGNQLNLKNINPKIIADFPVNIRVVINWNKDDTDIDLWVIDPNKEQCMYSHKETAIGGRLSNDFTRGFGPEQFLLKKAIKGKYQIKTNFFGETQVGVAGPTAIMAEIYMNYATGKQERKVVVFQNQKENSNRNEEGILIGEFEF